MKETELAEKFIEYFHEFDQYYEVPIAGWGSTIVDMVCIKNNIQYAIEFKNSFSLAVIEQAQKNRYWFHYSYVAVPHTKNNQFAKNICENYGIGVLELYFYGKNNYYIDETVKPKLNRKIIRKIELKEYQKKSIPGSVSNRITPWRNMINNINVYITKHEGCTIKEVFENVTTYNTLSTLKNCLYQYISRGIIKDFKIIKGKLYSNTN